MVRSENKFGSALSWADEVELEEAAAAAAGAQAHSVQKPNPFGNARPREVVLQERGVDWKNIDNEIEQPSLLQ
ncbi:Eukaryotic initiation factor [Melia azedarach]|uniref:Eukaryotic initiation factor n=1 Tax=Melia azedarach TaxID=155640 RepID=A0ACC1YXK8_MELAZ|nr:Eukaryotic initiation factor [Melia azedarach]